MASKRHIVISHTSLPVRLPVWQSATLWLLLDRFAAPGWAYGVVATLLSIVFAWAIHRQWTDMSRDVPGFGECGIEQKIKCKSKSLFD